MQSSTFMIYPMIQRLVFFALTFVTISNSIGAERTADRIFPDGWNWTSAEGTRVETTGKWIDDRFRFADAAHKYTTEDRASLTYRFTDPNIVIRLAGQNTSSYPGTGLPSHGKVAIFMDGKFVKEIFPTENGREILAGSALGPGEHELKLVHTAVGNSAGVRVEGFLTSPSPIGLVSLTVTGELQELLNDVRVNVMSAGNVIRSGIGRNWLSGQTTVAVPADHEYSLKITALGWNSQTVDCPAVKAGNSQRIDPVYLRRDAATEQYRFRYPRLNNQQILRAGSTFPARFLGFDTEIREVRIRRRNQNAVFTRVLAFTEDKGKAFYYDRQINVTLPDDTPTGVYDLEIDIVGGRRTSTCRSPSSVIVVKDFPENPRFVTFGHLDTSGQYQAEYMQRIATMANIIGADMVLISNSVNAAYISGALKHLQIPYVVNFGNHQMLGHQRWYGPNLGSISFGPKIAVLNYGAPWHNGIEKVVAELEKHQAKTIKIINAFEHNAPPEILDDFQITLIHDAHGPGEKVTNMGNTPTKRVGKSNSISFRLVEINQGKVVSATYKNHTTAPIPFSREQVSPVRIEKLKANRATIINEYEQAFPNSRITFLVPPGNYKPSTGIITSQAISDDHSLLEVEVRLKLEAQSQTPIVLEQQ